MKPEDLLKAFTELEDDTVLNAQRPPRRCPARRRRFPVLLAAALAASTIAITAFASGDGSIWFQKFFTQESGLTLTDSQKSYIGENTVSYQQGQTCNGYTVTLVSAISDGVKTLIQFKITAPEDVVLDLGTYTPGNWPGNDWFVNEKGEVYSTSGGWDTIDEDKTDNEVMLLYESDNTWYEKHIDQLFGHTWAIRLVGLDGGNPITIENMEDPPQKQHITDGVWEFEVVFPEGGNETLEFITEPVPCTAEHNFSPQGRIEDTVNITALKVRALSVALHFQHPEKDAINADFKDIYAVMKDGSQVLLNPFYYSPNFLTFYFDAPIVLTEIDHILLPNGTKLYPA